MGMQHRGNGKWTGREATDHTCPHLRVTCPWSLLRHLLTLPHRKHLVGMKMGRTRPPCRRVVHRAAKRRRFGPSAHQFLGRHRRCVLRGHARSAGDHVRHDEHGHPRGETAGIGRAELLRLRRQQFPRWLSPRMADAGAGTRPNRTSFRFRHLTATGRPEPEASVRPPASSALQPRAAARPASPPPAG
jgi:hypothetical protein